MDVMMTLSSLHPSSDPIHLETLRWVSQYTPPGYCPPFTLDGVRYGFILQKMMEISKQFNRTAAYLVLRILNQITKMKISWIFVYFSNCMITGDDSTICVSTEDCSTDAWNQWVTWTSTGTARVLITSIKGDRREAEQLIYLEIYFG